MEAVALTAAERIEAVEERPESVCDPRGATAVLAAFTPDQPPFSSDDALRGPVVHGRPGDFAAAAAKPPGKTWTGIGSEHRSGHA